MSDSSEKIERIHCNQCGHKTKHLVLKSHSRSGSEPYDEHCDIHWTTCHDIYECCGCEEVLLRRRFYFSEWNPGELKEDFYPPRYSRRMPSWKSKLPDEFQSLLEEIYVALHADICRLAVMGARTLIEMVMQAEVGKIEGFGKQLEALEAKGLVSKETRKVLSAALDAGHAAIHRKYNPSSEDVQHVMDIVENLMQLTVVRDGANKLRSSTPKRK